MSCVPFLPSTPPSFSCHSIPSHHTTHILRLLSPLLSSFLVSSPPAPLCPVTNHLSPSPQSFTSQASIALAPLPTGLALTKSIALLLSSYLLTLFLSALVARSIGQLLDSWGSFTSSLADGKGRGGKRKRGPTGDGSMSDGEKVERIGDAARMWGKQAAQKGAKALAQAAMTAGEKDVQQIETQTERCTEGWHELRGGEKVQRIADAARMWGNQVAQKGAKALAQAAMGAGEKDVQHHTRQRGAKALAQAAMGAGEKDVQQLAVRAAKALDKVADSIKTPVRQKLPPLPLSSAKYLYLAAALMLSPALLTPVPTAPMYLYLAAALVLSPALLTPVPTAQMVAPGLLLLSIAVFQSAKTLPANVRALLVPTVAAGGVMTALMAMYGSYALNNWQAGIRLYSQGAGAFLVALIGPAVGALGFKVFTEKSLLKRYALDIAATCAIMVPIQFMVTALLGRLLMAPPIVINSLIPSHVRAVPCRAVPCHHSRSSHRDGASPLCQHTGLVVAAWIMPHCLFPSHPAWPLLSVFPFSNLPLLQTTLGLAIEMVPLLSASTGLVVAGVTIAGTTGISTARTLLDQWKVQMGEGKGRKGVERGGGGGGIWDTGWVQDAIHRGLAVGIASHSLGTSALVAEEPRSAAGKTGAGVDWCSSSGAGVQVLSGAGVVWCRCCLAQVLSGAGVVWRRCCLAQVLTGAGMNFAVSGLAFALRGTLSVILISIPAFSLFSLMMWGAGVVEVGAGVVVVGAGVVGVGAGAVEVGAGAVEVGAGAVVVGAGAVVVGAGAVVVVAGAVVVGAGAVVVGAGAVVVGAGAVVVGVVAGLVPREEESSAAVD
ncbi:unnamed protein product [Closterium sp. NIES-65]|nr:unnamed protein product [Closterium sp. NIES-65]